MLPLLRCPKIVAFHHGENRAAWRFALLRFAPDGKGLTCRGEVCEGERAAENLMLARRAQPA
jgi:hypothetical protein